MHGTRTTAKILAGAAVAALAGCVSVDAPPTTPVTAPAAETVRPTQDVAPQIVEGPAREALEAALPTPPPSPPARTAGPERRRPKEPAPPRAQAPRPDSVPRQYRERPRAAPQRPAPPELPALKDLPKPHRPPASRVDICALGERYGGWSPGSDQARICRGAYGG